MPKGAIVKTGTLSENGVCPLYPPSALRKLLGAAIAMKSLIQIAANRAEILIACSIFQHLKEQGDRTSASLILTLSAKRFTR